MKTNNKSLFITYLARLLFALAAIIPFIPNAYAAEHCSDSFYIDETLENGARWDMCWEHRQREGIIFHHIFYTPKDGTRRMILNHASIAQIHVPYDDNGARFHDVSDFGIGGNNMVDLNADECPAGTLLSDSGKKRLCKQIETRDFAFKSGNNTSKGNNLSLFSVSPVGAYYYIPTWRFFDDGTIEPWIGATGALQRFGNNHSHGWDLGDSRVGISHLHNFFWKLDFDLNETHLDDVVEEINFPLVNGKRERTISAFNSETARKVNPDTMRRWRIRDKSVANSNGHDISYDVLINETGHQDIGPASEPFTHNDFYVTKQSNQEKFASHNPSGGSNLAEFVNGENLLNSDIVIWAGTTFYHMPRSEDAPHMDAHWSHIQIIPRDWHASNPLAETPTNNAPSITTPANQSSQVGDSISLNIEANDIDGDALSYSATGLPNGLQMNSSTGLISGNLSTAGSFNANIQVSDGTDSSSAQFSWAVSSVNTNTPPQVTNPGNQTGSVGNSVTLPIQAIDADGDNLTYGASGLPSGLQINSSSGIITGVLGSEGNHSINVTVSDSTVNTVVNFSWNVSVGSGMLSNEVSANAITVDGSVNDWNSISYFLNDPDDISGLNNQIDWLKISLAHSPQKVFMQYRNRQSVDPNNNSGSFVPWGWGAFLDTDNNAATGYSTGGIGADYIISGTVIEHYIGTGTSWSWDVVGTTQLRYQGDNIELSFARSLIANPQSMRIIFSGDNAAFNGNSTDLYPDSGHFSYAFTGVGNPNNAPVANNQQISVGSGASISLVLTASDVDSDPLNYQITQQPAHGSISGSAPNLVYTSDANFSGTDNFKFKVNDGTVDSQVATVDITVTGSNSGAISNFVSSGISIDGNDSEWSGLSRFADDTNDVSGNIDWRNTAFAHDNLKLYMLYNNWENIDPNSTSGSYLAWGWQTFIDTDKDENTGYRIGLIGADYVIEGNQLQRYDGAGSNWSWQHLGATQSQYTANIAELSLSRSQIGNPSSIRVLFSGDSESYSRSGIDLYPDGVNNNQASLQFFEYDFSGDSGSNERPVAFSQTVSVNAGSSVEITLIASDPDNNSLDFNIVSNPSNGVLSGTAPNLTYTPDANFTGQDSFDFNVSDGGLISSTVSITINVTSIQNGIFSNFVSSINIDGNIEEWSGLSSFDPDGNDIGGINNPIDWQRAAAAHNGSTFYLMYQSYNPINQDVNSGDFINWGWQTYIDIDENSSSGYKIGTIGAEYIIEGTQVQRYTGNGSSWSWVSLETANVSYNANTVEIGFDRNLIENPSRLRMIFVGDNGAYGGTSIDTYPNTLDYFEYQLTGGNQATSNRPIASDQIVNVSTNTPETFSLSATDGDNDLLTFEVVHQPANGRIAFSNSGNNIVYTPNEGFEGTDEFSYIASDGTFDSSVKTVTLSVVSGNSNGGSSSSGGTFPLQWILVLGVLALIRKHRCSNFMRPEQV